MEQNRKKLPQQFHGMISVSIWINSSGENLTSIRQTIELKICIIKQIRRSTVVTCPQPRRFFTKPSKSKVNLALPRLTSKKKNKLLKIKEQNLKSTQMSYSDFSLLLFLLLLWRVLLKKAERAEKINPRVDSFNFGKFTFRKEFECTEKIAIWDLRGREIENSADLLFIFVFLTTKQNVLILKKNLYKLFSIVSFIKQSINSSQ